MRAVRACVAPIAYGVDVGRGRGEAEEAVEGMRVRAGRGSAGAGDGGGGRHMRTFCTQARRGAHTHFWREKGVVVVVGWRVASGEGAPEEAGGEGLRRQLR